MYLLHVYLVPTLAPKKILSVFVLNSTILAEDVENTFPQKS